MSVIILVLAWAGILYSFSRPAHPSHYYHCGRPTERSRSVRRRRRRALLFGLVTTGFAQAEETIGLLVATLVTAACLPLAYLLAVAVSRLVGEKNAGVVLSGMILAVGFLTLAARGDDVAFLAHPRNPDGGFFHTQSGSERSGPFVHHSATQLVVRVDGTDSVLVDGGVQDFGTDLSGKPRWVSIVSDGGRVCDIHRINDDGTLTQLTHGEDSQPESVPRWSTNKRLWSCQPCDYGRGIAFISSRDGWKSPHEIYPAFTIYTMDYDGSNVKRIWHAGLGGVFGLHCGPGGRLYFASGEQQGSRFGLGAGWSFWSVNPDGTDWSPELSALPSEDFRSRVWDWPCITSARWLVASFYYDTRVYGELHGVPPMEPSPFNPPTVFNSPLRRNTATPRQMSFQRRGFKLLASWATDQDKENGLLGMLSHPFALPGNRVGTTWTGNQGDALMNLGIYSIDPATGSTHPSDMTKIVDEPDRHEWLGRSLRPYREIYGVDAPAVSTGVFDPEIPPGSPYGVVGTSALDIHEIVRNTGTFTQALTQIPADDIEYVRILAFVPTLSTNERTPFRRIDNGHDGRPSSVSQNWEGFSSAINERTGYFEQLIPVKKWRLGDGSVVYGPDSQGGERIMRSDGRPDTSIKFYVLADCPWTFQLLNAKQEAIWNSTAETWHQVRPGESMTRCNGCHAHHKPDDYGFENTFAASPDYPKWLLDSVETVVYERDIAPIVERSGITLTARQWENRSLRAYGSALTTIDDDERLTTDEQRTVRAWIDTGMMAEGLFADGSRVGPESKLGAYADTLEPTLAHAILPDGRQQLGAGDAWSGLDKSSLKVEFDGQDVTAELVEDAENFIWTLPRALGDGTLSLSVKDNYGNETAYSLNVTADDVPIPPDPGDEIERLKAEVARLTEENAALQSEVVKVSGERDALTEQIRQAIEVLK